MILTHGANSISKRMDIDFLFYTDFTNYDSNTLTDTPLVGQPGVYGYTDGQSKSINLKPYASGGPFNTDYGSIIFSYSFAQMPTRYKTIVHKSEFDSLTSEVWMKGGVNGAYVGLFGCQTLILDSHILLLMNPWDVTNAQFNIYNGASYHSASSATQKYVSVPSGPTWNWNHISVVYTQTSIYAYVNGILYTSITNQTSRVHKYSNSSITLNGTGSSGTTELGYLSWRVGDKSTNDHQTFPVPTAPYL